MHCDDLASAIVTGNTACGFAHLDFEAAPLLVQQRLVGRAEAGVSNANEDLTKSWLLDFGFLDRNSSGAA